MQAPAFGTYGSGIQIFTATHPMTQCQLAMLVKQTSTNHYLVISCTPTFMHLYDQHSKYSKGLSIIVNVKPSVQKILLQWRSMEKNVDSIHFQHFSTFIIIFMANYLDLTYPHEKC